jgi:hypothetical protein
MVKSDEYSPSVGEVLATSRRLKKESARLQNLAKELKRKIAERRKKAPPKK